MQSLCANQGLTSQIGGETPAGLPISKQKKKKKKEKKKKKKKNSKYQFTFWFLFPITERKGITKLLCGNHIFIRRAIWKMNLLSGILRWTTISEQEQYAEVLKYSLHWANALWLRLLCSEICN